MLDRTKKILSIVILCISALSLHGQQWSLDQESAPKVSVSGTSTLSDWEVVCADISDMPTQISINPEQPGSISDFGFKVLVETMDGGRGASMNDKVKAALKSTDHPYIEYRQTQAAPVSKAGEPGKLNVTSNGILSMAGTDKAISVDCTITVENDVLVISGAQSLKMSEFNMEPPTAMFGQIVTNDDVVVNYEFRYLKQ